MTHETANEDAGTGGALVPLGDARPRPAVPPRPLASFVMQVIACERRLGAYRDRRRGSSEEAGTRYREAAPAPTPHRRVDRSL